MSKDTYTYKQILLALRKEYIEYKRKLDMLMGYAAIYDLKDNYQFNLFKSVYESTNPELTLDKIIKEGNPKTLLALWNNIFGDRTPTRTIMLKDNNGNYYPNRKYNHRKNDFYVLPHPEYRREFTELADEIVSSDFAKNMCFDHTISAVNPDTIPGAKILPRSFEIHLKTLNSEVRYQGREDKLRIAGSRKPNEDWTKFTQDDLDYISQIEFPRDEFSEYHQNLIDECDDKEILLPVGYTPQVLSKFNIMEDENKVILTRTK